MKLLKPTWVSHDELPIFSVDIHPDGSRFATGGQGEDSGRIVIWNMAPIVNEDVENDENVPKMLCQMDNHLACVNCVRWSFSGKFLASGGDDKVVMIWKISKYATGNTAVFGGGGKVNVETWRCSNTLRGHNGDVLDMAWSPHDAWLASCSVDNTVIVWNALKMPEMVAVLKGHSGLVKGVAWDPVGKYIASQSDDKTLRVWRTADWQQDSVIHEPFEECGGTTHVLRLSWSPDGQYLVSAHAMNGGGPTAQIVEREGWRQDKDFVGHRKAVTCVRFNSNILQKQYRSSSKPQQYCCCAIGSRDRSLSVWLTALKRPLVVLHELFSNSVLDLSWSYTGLQLMACSWDGSVAFVEFSEDELGKPLSPEEKASLHERMYGKSLTASTVGQAIVVETPELLAVRERNEQLQQQQQQQQQQQALVANNIANTTPTSSQPLPVDQTSQSSTPLTPHKGPINKQIETRTSDGKRRITPMFIPPAPDTGDVPTPFGVTGAQAPTFRSSSEAKSSIVIEKRDDIVDPNVSHKSSDSTPPGSASKIASPGDQHMSGLKVLINAQTKKEEKSVMNSAPPPIPISRKANDRFEKATAVKRRLDKDSRMTSRGPSPKRMRAPSIPEKTLPQLTAPPVQTFDDHSFQDVQSALKLPPLRIGKRSVIQKIISGDLTLPDAPQSGWPHILDDKAPEVDHRETCGELVLRFQASDKNCRLHLFHIGKTFKLSKLEVYKQQQVTRTPVSVLEKVCVDSMEAIIISHQLSYLCPSVGINFTTIVSPVNKEVEEGSKKMEMILVRVKKEIIKKYEQGVHVPNITRLYPKTTSANCTVLKKIELKGLDATKGVKRVSRQRPWVLEDVGKLLLLSGCRRRMEVENGACSSPYGDLTRVRMYPTPVTEIVPEWEAVLGSTACGTAGNSQIVVIACEDSTLHVLNSNTGQRPLPPLVLPAPVSRLAMGSKKQFMAVTSLGGVNVWDVETRKVLVKNESLLPIMQSEPRTMVTILSSLLTENGCPLVSLSTGRAFMFSPDLGSWLLLGNSNDPVQRSASHKNFAELYPERDISTLPLACIQTHCRSSMLPSAIRMLHGTPVVPLCTVTYIEQQISACSALDSRKEYHYWVMCLAKFLVQEGLEKRLRVLCDELLGPAHSTAKYSKSWPSTIMGHSKHSLLREVLDFMSKELRLQRLYMEYNDLLNRVEMSALPNGTSEDKPVS
ncbi:protein HIRA [Anabrus simplex]|uniref:protein HIRA n=1 Tax=Anabrus simplex TaxID=316456 RepID=UPI0035A31FED